MPLFHFCPACAHRLSAPPEPPERVVHQDCAACGAVHYKNAKPTASALIVRDGQVLLGRRAVDPLEGRWDIPGGFLEPWEDPIEGVKREVLEETGLRIAPKEIVGILIDTYEDPSLYTFNVYYLADIVGGEPHPADDISELSWFRPADLPKVAFRSGREALRRWAEGHGRGR